MTEPAPHDPLPIVLQALTVTTGLVDAISFLGLGRVFTALMTGNVVFLGFAAAGATGFSAARAFASIAGFLIGAFVGGRLGFMLTRSSRRRWLLAVSAVEAGLLFAATLVADGYDVKTLTPVFNLYAIIVLTAIAMGVRNATVRRLAVPDLTTTVVTFTLADLAADTPLAGGDNPRLGRRLASVLLLFGGAAIGTLLIEVGGLALPLLVTGICIALSTTAYAMHPASQTRASDNRS